MFGSGILHWNFNDFFFPLNNIHNAANNWSLNVFSSKKLLKSGLVFNPNSLPLKFIHLRFENTWEWKHLLSESAIFFIKTWVLNCSKSNFLKFQFVYIRILDDFDSMS